MKPAANAGGSEGAHMQAARRTVIAIGSLSQADFVVKHHYTRQANCRFPVRPTRRSWPAIPSAGHVLDKPIMVLY